MQKQSAVLGTVAPPATTGRAKNAYLVVALLTLVNVFNFVDRQILAILAEPISKDLGLSDTQLGLLTGLAFALFYTVLGIRMAWLADAVKRIGLIAGACAVWSMFTIASAFANNFVQLALARIGVGVGESGATAPSYSVISDHFAPSKRALPVAIFAIGIPMGSMLGSAIGGSVAASQGWRTAFIVAGAPGLLIALVLFLTVREPVRGGMDSPDASAQAAPRPPIMDAVREFMRNRTLALTALSTGLCAFCGYATLNWFPTYLIRVKGMTLSEIAIYYSLVMGGGGILGTLASGYLSDRLGRISKRAYPLVPAVAYMLSLPFLVGFLLAPTWQVAVAFLIVPAFMNNMWLAPAMTLVQNSVAPNRRAISASIVIFALNLIGLGFGPLYVGLASDLAKPSFGVESLTVGLFALFPVYLLAVGAHLLTSRSIPRAVPA